MPYLSPPTLTHADQKTLLNATDGHSRDHLIYSLALGTGLRLAEIVGLAMPWLRPAFGRLTVARGRPRFRLVCGSAPFFALRALNMILLKHVYRKQGVT